MGRGVRLELRCSVLGFRVGGAGCRVWGTRPRVSGVCYACNVCGLGSIGVKGKVLKLP